MPEVRYQMVTGGRSLRDYYLVADVLNRNWEDGDVLLHGGAPGTDSLAVEWAVNHGVESREVRARWEDLSDLNCFVKVDSSGKRYNALAGFNRNQEMIDMGPWRLYVFPGGHGTRDCHKRAQRANQLRARSGQSLIDILVIKE